MNLGEMMKLIAFDVDGTILDTLDTIIHHVNETLYENGFYKVDDKKYIRKILGYGSEYLIEKSISFFEDQKYDKEIVRDVLEKYTKRYNSNPTHLTKPYKKIVELLQELKSEGYLIVAYSNKPDVILQPLMEDLFGENLFDYILGFEANSPAKPDPTVLNRIVEKMGAEKENAVYVGDSEVDVKTGQDTGVKTIAVTWGFRDKDLLETTQADFVVDTVEELKEKIDVLFKGE